MISVPTKYALRGLIYLARNRPNEFVQVRTLSEIVGTPGPFLAKVIKTLAAGNIVITKRGLSGGVKLRDTNISFYDVCAAMQDPAILSQCFLSKEPCSDENPCSLHEKWNKTRAEMIAFLKQTKLNS